MILSKKEKMNMRFDDFTIVGSFNQQLIGYIKHEAEHLFIFYDSAMQKKEQIKLPVANDAAHIEFFATNESILVFYEIKNGKSIKRYAISLQSNLVFTEAQLLYEISCSSNARINSMDVKVSSNEQYYAISHAIEMDNSLSVYVTLMNRNSGVVKTFRQSVFDKQWIMSEAIAVTNTGIIYWYALHRPSNRGSADALKLLDCGINEEIFEMRDVDLTNYTISDIKVKINEADKMLYTIACYSNSLYNNPLGFYLNQYSTTNNQLIQSQFTSVALASGKKEVDMKNLKIKNMGLKKDGGIEVAMERSFQNVRTLSNINSSISMSMGGMMDNSRTINEYYYDEIIIFNFKTDCKLNWSQTILKNQMTTDDNGIFSSFGCFEYPIGKVYLFNDDNLKSNRLIGAYVASSGELNLKEIPLSKEVQSVGLLPRSAYQISKSEIIIPCLEKDYLRFLIVKF
jgi:hypothetical protein